MTVASRFLPIFSLRQLSISRSWQNEIKGILAVRSDYCLLSWLHHRAVAASIGRSRHLIRAERHGLWLSVNAS